MYSVSFQSWWTKETFCVFLSKTNSNPAFFPLVSYCISYLCFFLSENMQCDIIFSRRSLVPKNKDSKEPWKLWSYFSVGHLQDYIIVRRLHYGNHFLFYILISQCLDYRCLLVQSESKSCALNCWPMNW